MTKREKAAERCAKSWQSRVDVINFLPSKVAAWMAFIPLEGLKPGRPRKRWLIIFDSVNGLYPAWGIETLKNPKDKDIVLSGVNGLYPAWGIETQRWWCLVRSDLSVNGLYPAWGIETDWLDSECPGTKVWREWPLSRLRDWNDVTAGMIIAGMASVNGLYPAWGIETLDFVKEVLLRVCVNGLYPAWGMETSLMRRERHGWVDIPLSIMHLPVKLREFFRNLSRWLIFQAYRQRIFNE
jgi:hypothetical protein